QFGGRQPLGAAGLGGGVAGGDQPAAGQVAYPQFVGQLHGGQVIPVQGAQRRVQADVQSGSQRVFDAAQRVGVAVHAHQRVVDFSVGGIQGDLHRVQAGAFQFFAQGAGQHTAVGVQPGDEPLGRLDQLDQVVAQRGFAAGEGQLGDAGAAALFDHGQPLVGVQFGGGPQDRKSVV